MAEVANYDSAGVHELNPNFPIQLLEYTDIFTYLMIFAFVVC